MKVWEKRTTQESHRKSASKAGQRESSKRRPFCAARVPFAKPIRQRPESHPTAPIRNEGHLSPDIVQIPDLWNAFSTRSCFKEHSLSTKSKGEERPSNLLQPSREVLAWKSETQEMPQPELKYGSYDGHTVPRCWHGRQ